MSRRSAIVLAAVLTLWARPLGSQTLSTIYDAPLPAALSTDPDLCAHAPCTEVMPGAVRFSARMGRPAYVEAYGPRVRDDDEDEDDEDDKGALVGYVFLSTDIVDIPAYSGKPVVTLIGMSADGTIVGTRILKHSEPILLVGIPESRLTRFVNQFIGKKAWDKVEIGRARAGGATVGIDGISGATVTVIAENQVVMRSANQVARQVGIIATEARPQAVFADGPSRLDWRGLLRDGSVQQLLVSAADVGATDTRDPLIDIYFGYLNTPAIGRSVLGDNGWERLMARLGPADHAIFLAANGRESFKGSGFVRGGIFDRVQVAQDIDTFTFRDTDYLNLYAIDAPGAPPFAESAIFIIRSDTFSAAYPWSLVFLASTVDRTTGERTFLNFDREYWLHAKYLAGGRPHIAVPEAAWVAVWRGRIPEIILFVMLLAGVATAHAWRDRLTRASSRRNKWPVDAFKYVAWTISIGFVGFYLMAQPSITQVLTWFHALLFQWNWQLFLSEPFVFLFWLFIVITVFVWGRGVFCGWLCPFGSLTEILHIVAGRVGLKRFQFKLPMAWHDRLRWVKYGVFVGLLGVSFLSMGTAEALAEVEPFKTTFLIGLWNRSWPFALFAGGLLALSLFIERPFCKYLCPLGAALAMPSTFRWHGLRRKSACNSCQACAVRCGSQAIDRHGRIDHRECLLCLECMVLYTDAHTCPPLAQERKRRETAGLPLTPIDTGGYFVPLTAVGAGTAAVWPAKPVSTVDPRMQTDPITPVWASHASRLRRLAGEFRHHFWPVAPNRPWPRHLAALVALAAAGVVLALAVGGWLPPVSVIGAALVLSVWEAQARMASLRFVKEGRWWRHQYRVATWMDMLSYVGFKNLLIGAVLFLTLKGMDLLVV
jgi:NosR/NirI family transcriptional regulator, nitrous oxide reductase regulator